MSRVALFVPCLIDQLYPDTAFNTVKLLEKAGCEVHYNPGSTCCGFPPYDAGSWEESKVLGQKFLVDMQGEHFIVSPSTVCTGMVQKGYDDLFTNSVEHNSCRQVQRSIYEISDFLVNVLEKEYFGAEFVGVAMFHAPCSTHLSTRGGAEALKLLEHVGGLELVGTSLDDRNCGAGKSMSGYHEAVSVAMAAEKAKKAMDLRAEYIISTDPFCIMHLQSYIEKNNLPLKTIHLVDVLTSGWANI